MILADSHPLGTINQKRPIGTAEAVPFPNDRRFESFRSLLGDPSLRSGFRLQAPVASLLTPAKRLKISARGSVFSLP